MGDVEDEPTVETASKFSEFCTKSPWTFGSAKMKTKNYLEVRKMAAVRSTRKRSTARFIVDKVKEMSAAEMMAVGFEMDNVLPSPWTDIVHSLEPTYYGV